MNGRTGATAAPRRLTVRLAPASAALIQAVRLGRGRPTRIRLGA
ncbi:MAG TPA: hypothetical protein VFA70_02985 [Dehalococcoidia bacterium]|nr:hypothetical protein [Dehalococcoidia bacterium]